MPFWQLSLLLGLTQTAGYGTLYYAFGVLAPGMAAETGLSLATIFGLFSLAMVGGSMITPRAGAAMDRIHPGLVMAFGSGLCAACLAAWSIVPGKAPFIIFLVATELASVLVLYEAAFIAATHLAGERHARRVIAGITFVAGFASTVFWPLTQWLLTVTDWRGVQLAYAGLHLGLCLPVHALLSRVALAPPGDGETALPDSQRPVPAKGLPPERARLVFVLMLAGSSATSFVVAAMHLHLITLLGALGLGGSAALIGAWIGPAQVGARVVEFTLANRMSIHVPSIISAAALPLAIMLLLAGAPSLVWGIGFAIIFGVGQGLAFIVRGVLPLKAFGRAGYGAITGKLNGVRLFATALAPFLIAIVIERAGAAEALALLTAAGLAGTAALLAVARLMR